MLGTVMAEYPNRPRTEVNPNNEPTGHYTGRCGKCGSSDLWDDNSAYGCNNCGGFWTGVPPKLRPNRPTKDYNYD